LTIAAKVISDLELLQTINSPKAHNAESVSNATDIYLVAAKIVAELDALILKLKVVVHATHPDSPVKIANLGRPRSTGRAKEASDYRRRKYCG
jgi:hypothetical protein